jgi:PAS domain S-box-containing protein
MVPVSKQLLSEKDILLKAIESANDVIWAMDPAGNFIYVSPSVFRLRGYTPEEVMAIPSFDAIVPDDRPMVESAFRDALGRIAQGDRDISTIRVRLRQPRKDGTIVWTEVATDYVFDGEGDLALILGITRDISELVESEERTRKLVDELQQALSKVKMLSGYLPICASCKKIREDTGYWNSIELFIRDHSEAEFTHGLCPGCAKEIYGEWLEAKEGQSPKN